MGRTRHQTQALAQERVEQDAYADLESPVTPSGVRFRNLMDASGTSSASCAASVCSYVLTMS